MHTFVLWMCLGLIEFCIPQMVDEYPTLEECKEMGTAIVEEWQSTGQQGAVACQVKTISIGEGTEL